MSLDGYSTIRRFFGGWCHKIIPLIYDDSLSYYELLGRLRYKLNEVIDTINGLIEGDVEGYLQELIDTYAEEKITELLNEIGESTVREIAEEVINEMIGDYVERLEDVEENTRKLNLFVNNEVIFNREHYIWSDNPGETWGDGGTHYFTKADLMVTDAANIYYFIHDSEYGQIVKVPKGSGDDTAVVKGSIFPKATMGWGHGCYKPAVNDGESPYIVTLANQTLYFISPETLTLHHSIPADSGSVPTLGRIAYDPTVEHVDPDTQQITYGQFYACGTMATDNNYTVYEITLTDNNTFTAATVGSFSTTSILSIPQNMTAYNGTLYIAASNPNIIIQVDIATCNIISIVSVGDRFDRIIPCSELQGISYDYNDGKLYILGYNSLTASGTSHLQAVGSIKLDRGSFPTHTDIGRQNYILYVDRTADRIASLSPGSDHDLTYNKYTNACGWLGEYDYLPFYHLWEAVEAAVGAFQYSGKPATIRIADTTLYGEIDVPAHAVQEISGYNGVGNASVYARVRYMNIYGSGSVNLIRIGFTGQRIGAKFDITTIPGAAANIGCLRSQGANVFLSDCCMLRVTNTIIDDNHFRALLGVVQNGSIICSAFGAYSSWEAVSDWLGHLPTWTYNDVSYQTYFAYANAGWINYSTSTSPDYTDTDDAPTSKTSLGYINFTQA